MRRIILLLSFFLSVQSVFGADYSVFKVQGEVTVKKAGEQDWKPVARRDVLSSRDVLRMGADAAVILCSPESGQLFKHTGEGQKTVYDIVSSARASSARITSLALQEMAGEMKDIAYGTNDLRVGAVYRGDSDMAYLDSLAASFRADKSVSLSIIEEDGMLHFILKNRKKRPRYVNVVRVSPSGERSVCLEFRPGSVCDGLLLPGGASIELPQYLFSADGSRFYPFSTSFPYDTRALQRRL